MQQVQASSDGGRSVRSVHPKKRPQGQHLSERALAIAKRDFLATLLETCNIAESCRRANVARKTAVAWRDVDAAFAEAWDEALEAGLDDLEQTARKRAHGGSDLLLMFLLKAHRPDRYRESVKHEYSGPKGQPIPVRFFDAATALAALTSGPDEDREGA